MYTDVKAVNNWYYGNGAQPPVSLHLAINSAFNNGMPSTDSAQQTVPQTLPGSLVGPMVFLVGTPPPAPVHRSCDLLLAEVTRIFQEVLADVTRAAVQSYRVGIIVPPYGSYSGWFGAASNVELGGWGNRAQGGVYH
jgi:hypothetical protein